MSRINLRIIATILLFITIVFYHPFFLKGFIPLPADIILGAYHPWKDISWGDYNPPYPYKIFESQDAISFYYPVKLEAARQIKNLQLPLWNRYIFNGTPLLGDGHSGSLYPLNILLLVGDFNLGWSIFIIIQPFLAALFLYIYLRKHDITPLSAIFGGISYGFGSYFINQTELATIGHTALWIPLMLLGIDYFSENTIRGILITAGALTMMFLSGFIQFFLYGSLLAVCYFFYTAKLNLQRVIPALLTLLLFCLLSGVQLLPFLNFLPHTVRWHGVGLEVPVTEWLLKPNLLITLISPDFFGHPATANWTESGAYYEFVAYLGPFLLAMIFCSLYSKQKIKIFYLWSLLISLLLVIKNPLSLFLYGSGIPVISSLTPSRLLIIFSLSASILIAIGSDVLIKFTREKIIRIFFILMVINILMFIVSGNKHFLLPVLFTFSGYASSVVLKTKAHHVFVLIIITIFALFYQANKYLVFTPKNLVYPETKVTQFLKDNLGDYRYLSIHPEIFPSNSNLVYSLSTSNGYHPIQDYDYNATASKLQFENNTTLFGRTIFLTRINQSIIDFTNAKYILNKGDIKNAEVLPLVSKIMTEGDTVIYEIISPTKKPAEKMPGLYQEQRRWAYMGLVLSSIGMIIYLILFTKIDNR